MLNPEQLAVVDCANREIYVVAGPGSGKTHTLVNRIKLDMERGVSSRDMAIVTFTNAAANELVERLGVSPNKFYHIGTLHSYMVKVLTESPALVGYRPGFSILPETAREELLQSVARFLRIKVGKKKLLLDPPAAVKAEYLFRLKAENIVDFDTLLECGLELLKARQFSKVHLYVDEVQDSGPVDWKIYDAIPAVRKIFIGDFDQSLFGFRGAVPNQFIDRASTAGFLTLSTNYRCDAKVCDAANSVISHCPNRIPKKTTPIEANGNTGDVLFHHFANDAGEALYLAENLVTDPENAAVLVRTNALVEQIKIALKVLRVPVKSPEFIRLPVGYDAARSLIGLYINPTSTMLAQRFLRHVLKGDVDRLTLECQVQNLPLSSKIAKEFPGFDVNDISQLPTAMAKHGLSRDAVAMVATRIQKGNLTTLQDVALDLSRPEDWAEAKTGESGVEVTTIHKAKGREWDRVFLVGWEDGAFPLPSGDYEEEIRLAFVAITRARHILRITACNTRKNQWGRKVAEVSPFVSFLANYA